MARTPLRVDPEMTDEDNPELTDEMVARARPAREVLREQFGETVAAEMLRPKRGRPSLAKPKALLSLYLSQDVIDYFRSTGAGWQTRINAALQEWVKNHTPAA